MDEVKKRRARRELEIVGNVAPTDEIAPWEREILAGRFVKPQPSTGAPREVPDVERT